jgi:uridine kinase
MSVEFSVSTWRQPMPPPAGPRRAAVIDALVATIDATGAGQLRIAIDGFTAAGKTTFGHELARGLHRPVLRASLDDFKRPWSERHRYDRESGEGYYRNAFNYDAARRLLLEPTDAVVLCGIDPLTQIDHSAVKTVFPRDGVLIVDGVFACRPEINDAWDLRIWVEIDAELSVRRGSERDGLEALHRDRYLASERIYVAEVDPCSFVEVIVDNTDFDGPVISRGGGI